LLINYNSNDNDNNYCSGDNNNNDDDNVQNSKISSSADIPHYEKVSLKALSRCLL